MTREYLDKEVDEEDDMFVEHEHNTVTPPEDPVSEEELASIGSKELSRMRLKNLLRADLPTVG